MLIKAKDLHKTDFEAFEIDPQWNYENKKENKMHRIHAYPAKFPAFITKKALQIATSKNFRVNTVADIFCGCGTTSYEASRAGKNFWGCDINPVATLIAKVKSGTYQQDMLDKYFMAIEAQFNLIKQEKEQLTNINERIKYWFDDQQIEELYKLKSSIYQSITSRSKYRNFFLCAFSNILKPTSRWLQKSIKPTIDQNKKTVGVWDAFSKQFKAMKKANAENTVSEKVSIAIETSNFMNKRILKEEIDLLVTSPPYVTSYEYADLHQMSLLWLDFASDFRVFRKGSIGSSFHHYDADKNTAKLNKTGSDIFSKLTIVDKKVANNTAKYFVDMQKVIQKSYLLLNPGGFALFVIGNTEYKQVRINNAKHLTESMFEAGYTQIEVSKRKISNKFLTPYRSKNGRFSSNKSSRKIYAEEFVIMGRKR